MLRLLFITMLLTSCAPRAVYRDVRYVTVQGVEPLCSEANIIPLAVESAEREESKLWWVLKFSGSLLLEFLGAEKLWDS